MSIPYAGALELHARDALSLRVELHAGAPRVVVLVRTLEAWLAARGAAGKLPLAAVIAAQGDALQERAQGDAGVLTSEEAVMVVASVGGPALRLIPEVMAACRDGETAAGRVLRDIIQRVKAFPVDPLAPPESAAPPVVPPPAQNLTEHMKRERQAIIDALDATRWDRGAAADRLEMSRRTFYRRMSEYGLLEGAKPRGIKAQRMRQAGLAGMKGAKKPGEGKSLARTSPGARSKRGA